MGGMTRANEQVILDGAERYRTLVEAVNAARHSLDLSVFRCDDKVIIESLEAARARGVRVRVLLTNRAKGGRRQLAWLEAVLRRSDIDVTRYAGACHKYHAKFALIDGTRALVTSMNLAREHFEDTDDLLFVSRDPSLHLALGAMFESDWTGRSTSIVPCDRLIVSPDNARKRLADLFAAARQSIVIVDHKLADLEVLDELLAAQARGLTVHLITDRKRFGMRAHSKTILIDNRRAIIGSLALSKSTLNRRRDVAVIVDDPALVRAIAAHIRPLQPARTKAAAAGLSVPALT